MICISTKPELSILSYCPLSAAHTEGVLTDWCLMNEFLLHCIYLLWVVVYSRTVDFIWNSEDNFQGSIVCFHHVGLRDGAQVISLGSKHHYPLIHLANPYEVVLKPCLGYSLVINYCHLLFEKVMLTCYDILFLSLSPHLMHLISNVLRFKTHPSWVGTLHQPEAMRSLVKYFSYDSVSSCRKQK